MEGIILSSSDSEDNNQCSPSRKRRKLDRDQRPALPRGAIPPDIGAPPPGFAVNRTEFRKAGPYIIGPEVQGIRGMNCLVQFIGWKENKQQFYLLKIVQQSTKPDIDDRLLQDEHRAKALLHTEYSLLNLLKNVPGVIRQHGLFSDFAYEDMVTASGECVYTGVVVKRHILVLDCFVNHRFCDRSISYNTLHEYIRKTSRIPEGQALLIFHAIVKIVENIHQKNIIHKNLKIDNIILNPTTMNVTIVDFWLGQFSSNDIVLHFDQRVAGVYLPPEVIRQRPFKGKPSDMWALGVIFYLMLYRKFPFYQSTYEQLLIQISSGKFEIPQNAGISADTIEIIKGLFNVDPAKRMTATQVREKLESIMAMRKIMSQDQRVPEGGANPSSENFSTTFNCGQIIPKFYLDEEQAGEVPISLNTEDVFFIDSLIKKYLSWLELKKDPEKDISVVVTRKPTELCAYTTQQLDSGTVVRVIKQKNRIIIEAVMGVTPESISKDKSQLQEFMAAVKSYLSTKPQLRRFAEYEDFDGVLTIQFATGFYNWVTKVFKDTQLVQNVLINSNRSVLTRVVEFLEKCEVRMSLGPKLSKGQPNDDMKDLLRLMLEATGYNKKYFRGERYMSDDDDNTEASESNKQPNSKQSQIVNGAVSKFGSLNIE